MLTASRVTRGRSVREVYGEGFDGWSLRLGARPPSKVGRGFLFKQKRLATADAQHILQKDAFRRRDIVQREPAILIILTSKFSP
jgi:hypothetical protein